MARSLRCLVRLHSWRENRTDDGEQYLRCKRCGVDRSDPPSAGTNVQHLSGMTGMTGHGGSGF